MTIRYLDEDTSYSVRVKINDPSCPWSGTESTTTSKGECFASQITWLRSDFESIDVWWSPTWIGGTTSSTLIGGHFFIEYAPTSTSGTTETATIPYRSPRRSHYHMLTGLTNDVEYTLRVRANRDGCEWSESKTATPKDECSAPRNLTLGSRFESISVWWDTPTSFQRSSGYYIDTLPHQDQAPLKQTPYLTGYTSTTEPVPTTTGVVSTVSRTTWNTL